MQQSLYNCSLVPRRRLLNLIQWSVDPAIYKYIDPKFSCRVQDLLLTMKFLQDCWITLLELFNAATFMTTGGSPFQQALQHQGPLSDNPIQRPLPGNPIQPPVFIPPSRSESNDSAIKCNYTALGPGWSSCSTEKDRTCWLKGPGTQIFDIHTDYEQTAPVGITRKVYQKSFLTVW